MVIFSISTTPLYITPLVLTYCVSLHSYYHTVCHAITAKHSHNLKHTITSTPILSHTFSHAITHPPTCTHTNGQTNVVALRTRIIRTHLTLTHSQGLTYCTPSNTRTLTCVFTIKQLNTQTFSHSHDHIFSHIDSQTNSHTHSHTKTRKHCQ